MTPVYCKDCRSQNSWDRVPAEDIKSISGRVMWVRWRCRVCGKKILYPAGGRR